MLTWDAGCPVNTRHEEVREQQAPNSWNRVDTASRGEETPAPNHEAGRREREEGVPPMAGARWGRAPSK